MRVELVVAFENAAREIFGDAAINYLEKRTVLGGLVEYVRGDVNASWIFFQAGHLLRADQEAEILQALDKEFDINERLRSDIVRMRWQIQDMIQDAEEERHS